MNFKLVDLSEQHYRDRSISLSSKNMFSVTVGRQKEYSHDSRILLDNPTVSKNHAEIYYSHGFFYIKDRSKNRTFVNNVKLSKRQPMEIKCGDVVRFGSLQDACPQSLDNVDEYVPTFFKFII